MNPAASVIDIGSNSIKILVAQRAETNGGHLTALHNKAIDARIGTGISEAEPRLSEEGMTRGVDAVRELLAGAAPFSPIKTALVATSAVRDAANGAEFCQRIERETGYGVRVLSGDEEANLIGRGLRNDPALGNATDFYVFDLGGGSLECLAFRNRRIEQALSLQLGCVRLTEQCLPNPRAPFSEEAHRKVTDLTKLVFAHSGFHFNLSPESFAVGTGGTMTTARAVIAARRGKTLETSDSILTVEELRELLAFVGWFHLEERRRIPALPPARADVFPTALATIIAVAEIGSVNAFRNSLYNLRWGLADETLS